MRVAARARQAAHPRDELNESQSAAAEHRGPPLLVVAGAGSGKTAMLAARAASLVRQGQDPQRMMLLTFSRRAAAELARRVAASLALARDTPAALPPPLPPATAGLPWAGTFHSIGARLLRGSAADLGLDPGFTVLDRADAEDVMALERQALGAAASTRRFPLKGTCAAIASRVVNSERPLSEVLQSHFPWCQPFEDELRRLFRAYALAKQRLHALDFDDVLLAWAEALATPVFGRAMAGRFDEVLVDEYQDTNRLQARILQGLRPDGRGLAVVGDDAQSIYGFRGADVGNILGFASQFGPGTRTVLLERNYRSSPQILAASNAVIAQAQRRQAKTMWSSEPDGPRPRIVAVADESAQAGRVADEVLRLREAGLPLRRQAVLFRTATHSAALELELQRRRIPFVKYGGLRFMESTHVKDLLALLRWTHNPRHTLAGYRASLLVEGVGPATARRLADALRTSGDPARELADWPVPATARAAWPAFVRLWQRLRERPGDPAPWPAAFGDALDWYRAPLRRLHADHAAREADLQALRQMAAGYPSRERFLTEMALDPPQSSSGESGVPSLDEDWLVLSTIHSAKGQEWSAVQVLNVVDGCLPADLATGHAAEIDEERRLLYVAMTRARRHLDLLVPQRFYVTQQRTLGDRHVYALPSRFLTPEVVALCEATTEGPAPADDAAAAPLASSGPPAVDIAARLVARW